jgi:hypothetical protein
MTDGTLDEALIRLRDTGPERHGRLSNHAPMAVEVLVRHGHADEVHRWIDGYRDLLEEAPQGIDPISPEQWRDPLDGRSAPGTGSSSSPCGCARRPGGRCSPSGGPAAAQHRRRSDARRDPGHATTLISDD